MSDNSVDEMIAAARPSDAEATKAPAPDLAAESLAANIETAKEIVRSGHVGAAAVAEWLTRQCPGAFADTAAAIDAIEH